MGALLMRRRRPPAGGAGRGTLVSGDPNEAVIAALNPVGWYKFDEGTGNTITDYGSAGADLTGAGTGGSWVTGGFDTEATRYFGAGATLGISGTDGRTVILAVSPQTVGADAVGAQWIGDGFNGTRWSCRDGQGGSAVQRMEIGGEGYNDTTLSDFADGTWTLRGWSMSEGGTALNDCRLYADGSVEDCSGSVVTINTVGNFDVCRANTTVVDVIVGYVLVFDYELTTAQLASVRTALTAIMAARGITLP